MLVDQNRSAIRVKNEKTCRFSPLRCFLFKSNTGFFELLLNVADVSKRGSPSSSVLEQNGFRVGILQGSVDVSFWSPL